MAAQKKAVPAGPFIALVGLDYPPEKRAEKSDLVTDLPKESVPWLLETNAIRPATKKEQE